MSGSGRYVFAGGGTGGHVTPNLAIAAELAALRPGSAFLYVGTRRGAERRLAEAAGLDFAGIAARAPASPRRPLSFLRFAVALTSGVLRSLWLLWRFRADAVIATGGYASVPVVLAAAILRRRVFLHEQNAVPGRANRFLARFAHRIGVAFEEARAFFPPDRSERVGYPVRAAAQGPPRDEARLRLGLPIDARVVFVVGGSMGSRSINRGLLEGLKRLLEDPDLHVLHGMGLAAGPEYDAESDCRGRLARLDLDADKARRYRAERFFDDVGACYAAADVVVSRAGAGAIMELAAQSKPALLVPKADGDGHQVANAVTLVDGGRARMLIEDGGDEGGEGPLRVHGDQLAATLVEMLGEPQRCAAMGRALGELAVTDGARRGAEAVLALIDETGEAQQRLRHVVGLLTHAGGRRDELLFNLSTIGHGAASDVRLERRGRRERALIRRVADGRGGSSYLLVPRRGEPKIDGRPVAREVVLEPGQTIEIGPNVLRFDTEVRWVEAPDRRGGILRRVLTTGFGTLASRGFGLVRMLALGATFATTGIMDVFAAALTLSNLFRRIFAENAVDSAFLPSYLMLLRGGRGEEAARLLRTVLTAATLITTAVVVAAIVTAPWWIAFFVPGFAAKGLLDEVTELTRWMMPYLVLVTVAAVFSAVLRAHNRFAVPAWSSLSYSIGVIIGIALHPRHGIAGLGIGVLLGGLGQALVHLPSLLRRRGRAPIAADLRPLLAWGEPGMRKIRAASPKIVADVTVTKLGSVVDVMIVSTLAIGDTAVLFYALILFQLPFALVSQSISTVVLKEFSEWQAARDGDFCRRLVASGINWNVFLLLPISALMVVLSVPIVELALQYAAFDATATTRVAAALCAYAIGLVGWGVQGLMGRFYAARLEVGQAMAINVAAIALNVGLSLLFVYGLGLSFVGVALGTSISFLANAAFRVWHLNRNLRREGGGMSWSDVLPSTQTAVFATLVAVPVGYVALEAVRGFDLFGTFASRLVVLAVPTVAFLGAFAATALVLRSPEMDEIVARVSRLRPRRPDPSRPAQRAVHNPRSLSPSRLLAIAESQPHLLRNANLAGRVNQFLTRGDWQTRNAGVKLATRLKLRSLRWKLAEMATDRRPAPLLHRLLGGDFVEPGFVRRNALDALRKLEVPGPEVEAALIAGLDDPYWEARAAAARALASFAPTLSPPTRERASLRLAELCAERNFEVAVNAVSALQATALDAGVLATLEALHYHPNWQVRSAVVKAYYGLYLRGVVEDRALLLARIEDVLITCDSFHPTFELKEVVRSVRNGLSQAPAKEAAAAAV